MIFMNNLNDLNFFLNLALILCSISDDVKILSDNVEMHYFQCFAPNLFIFSDNKAIPPEKF